MGVSEIEVLLERPKEAPVYPVFDIKKLLQGPEYQRVDKPVSVSMTEAVERATLQNILRPYVEKYMKSDEPGIRLGYYW